MGTNTLTNRANGQTIVENFFNDIHQAMNGDFIGRNATGVPTSGQNLGTVALPWGVIRSDSLILGGSAVDPSIVTSPPNIVISGKKRSTSNQPQFITPNGAALSFILDGTPVNLALSINSVSVSVTTDITKSSLTAAPSTNNTALVNDTDAADQYETRLWGEPESRKDTIVIDNVGSEITALVGQFAAFMINNGSATEYFIAYVKSNTELSKCRRGYFYDSSLNPKNRIFFSNNDTITLLKWGHIFVENDAATVDVTYTPPTISFESPSGPATGDYWYDLGNQVWKRYDGASFIIINRTLVGSFVNSTTACIGARCEDFYAAYTDLNTLDLEKFSNEIVQAKTRDQKCSVAGINFNFGSTLPVWNITTDLAPTTDMYDATEQSSRGYYLYLKDDGNTVISDIHPYWRHDLSGAYHPHNPWRCVGAFYNDSSSDIQEACGLVTAGQNVRARTGNGFGSTSTSIRRYTTLVSDRAGFVGFSDSVNFGSEFRVLLPFSAEIYAADGFTGGSTWGPVVNASSAEQSGATNFPAQISRINGVSGQIGSACVHHRFKIDDIIQLHSENPTPTSEGDAAIQVYVTKMGVF